MQGRAGGWISWAVLTIAPSIATIPVGNSSGVQTLMPLRSSCLASWPTQHCCERRLDWIARNASVSLEGDVFAGPFGPCISGW